ncbi:uroporphyrinogen decarboxylase [Pseudoclavibacter sp. 13-3]|uniref:uroporphyrinogen decarboxylase n=1 Tax=Pseudoclavibacter sp. 13-3 TaxID=2901228 RepID=UPI003FA7ADCF
MSLPAAHPLNPVSPASNAPASTADSALVRALRGESSAHVPVWFMRQAGRSLPEYRTVREGVAMLDACLRPDLAAEITLQPVRRHHVDAAVFFSDIVVPLKLAGVDVDIVPGRGPVFGSPVRTAAAVDALPELTADQLAPIAEAVRLTVAELGGTPLIGFAGAPFTLAAYLVEGGPSKDHLAARALMFAEPEVWERLVMKMADYSAAFLRAQVLAGASTVQLFDSWVGSLAPAVYRAHVRPASARVLASVADLRTVDARSVPRIHFGLAGPEMLCDLRDAGADAVGVDYRTELADAIDRLGLDVPVQGNLDPALLGAPSAVREAAADRILAAGQRAAGHVFNLGHGVPPTTDPDVLTRLVAHVHAWEATER